MAAWLVRAAQLHGSHGAPAPPQPQARGPFHGRSNARRTPSQSSQRAHRLVMVTSHRREAPDPAAE